jgi:hypothetical protein
MADDANQEHLTKRLLVDRDPTIHTAITDRELIAEELESFKTNYPDGGPNVPWGNSLRLDEDDWILRQLFDMAGCDPSRPGHWRLILGVLAEFCVNPALPDTWVRKYSPAAVNAYTWSDEQLDKLFEEAAEIAKNHQKPRWGREKICEELIRRKSFVPKSALARFPKYSLKSMVRNLLTIVHSKREEVSSGRLDGDPQLKERRQAQLSLFKFNNKEQTED